MNHTRTFLIIFGILLFTSGSLINLFFSSNLLWGEMEALIFAPQVGDKNLDISCPLIIAPSENGIVNTVVTNSLVSDATKPQVNLFVSDQNDIRFESQTLELEPLESQPLQWTVTSADIVFDRLILVSVLQRPYRELESRQGTCSIYVYSLFGMNGKNTAIAIVEFGVISSLLGMGLLFYYIKSFSVKIKKMMQVNVLFFILVLLGIFSALPRLWGLTLFFNSLALLSIAVAYIEIIFGRSK